MSSRQERIQSGKLARAGLINENSIAAVVTLLDSLVDSKLETVRLLFTDQHGILRGKTIVSSAFESSFRTGINVPSTLLLKDTSHRTVFPVWSEDTGVGAGAMQGAGDIMMVPDVSTFRRLPWSSHSAWILCDVYYKSGQPIPYASRQLLRTAIDALAARNMELKIGLEVEFHVFEIVDQKLDHHQAGMPGDPPLTRNLAQGYQFLTESRYAELEPIMDELRRACEKMLLPIRSTEVEFGPSQFEFTFDPGDCLSQADNMVMFRTLVKEVCARRGLHATFMCRPKLENCASSGWHLHQSIVDSNSGVNMMMPADNNALSSTASQWIAGLLAHAEESCLLSTPTVNGYKRYQPYQLAPDRIQWGRDNRGAMIRALMEAGDSASRVENRVAETAANPYFFIASQILSGLDGIERKLDAPKAIETPYSDAGVDGVGPKSINGEQDFAANPRKLPGNLFEAIELFDQSEFYRRVVGDEFVEYLVQIKRAEWNRYLSAISDWEQAEYFSIY